MSPTKYLSATETAKLIRKALKESCPGVKFSVRSSRYAGGSSVRISWTDGPTTKQIEEIGHRFQGSYFDGSIDYKGARYHKLDGVPTSMGPDYVFCDRENTDRAIEGAILQVVEKYGAETVPTLEDFKSGRCHMMTPLIGADGDQHWSWSSLIRRTLEDGDLISEGLEPTFKIHPSATLARVEFTGTDGYMGN